MQTAVGGDPAYLRWAKKDARSVDLFVAEERSLDTETGHAKEGVGYIAIE